MSIESKNGVNRCSKQEFETETAVKSVESRPMRRRRMESKNAQNSISKTKGESENTGKLILSSRVKKTQSKLTWKRREKHRKSHTEDEEAQGKHAQCS